MDRNEKHTEMLRRLGEQVEALTDSDQWRQWLNIAAKFHDYSVNNQFLILAQRPDASRVAGYKTWQSLGRQVRKGERGIGIFAPMGGPCKACGGEGVSSTNRALTCARCGGSGRWQSFRVVYVFDVSQTDGEPLDVPEWPVMASMPDETLFGRLVTVCEGLGLTFETTSTSANGARGWYSPDDRSVTVVDSYPLASQARTILHELAHSLDPGCHEARDTTTRAERELVAESAAYLVGTRLGLDMAPCSTFYLASWGGQPDELERLARSVLDVAGRLEEAVTKWAGEPYFGEDNERQEEYALAS